MGKESRTITVAAAQLAARPLAEARQALVDIEEAVRQARQARADLVVLPECCYPAYWLGSVDKYRQADILRGEAIDKWFGQIARQHRISIVAGRVREGFATSGGASGGAVGAVPALAFTGFGDTSAGSAAGNSGARGGLRDSSVFYDSAGMVRGRHDKTFLWAAEHDWYEPGTRVRPAETEFGSVGMLVCAEGRSPEVFASLAAQGAGLLAMPTAWVNAPAKPGEYYNPQPDFMIPARATEFGLPIVCANKFGRECEEAEFCGMSLIVAADGEVLAKAPADQPALLVARVRPEPRRLVLPEATVQRLLDARPPVLPPADAKPVPVAVLGARLAGLTAEEVSGRLAGRGVAVVLRPAQDDGELATGPYRRDASPLQTMGGARVGTVTAGQAGSFVWPRILALDGAQVLCVTGVEADAPTLRTRAAENRVFVVASPRGQPTVIGPSGAIIAQASAADEEPLVVDLPLAEAGNKIVAPQTDIWLERRVGAYRLTGG